MMDFTIQDNRTFVTLLTDAIARERLQKQRLEFEDAAKMIAFCQGEVAGIRSMISTMIEFEMCSQAFILTIREHELMEDLHSISDEDFALMVVEVNELKSSNSFKMFDQKVSEIVDRKKNYLFYEADRGRDLDHTHGFRDGVLRIRSIISDILFERDERSKKFPLFGGSLHNAKG